MRTIRVVAWIALLAFTAFSAYAQRYAVSPDGISYLDMSDAVVTGDWSRLVNLYWSPLYPTLVGLVRTLTSASCRVTWLHPIRETSWLQNRGARVRRGSSATKTSAFWAMAMNN